MAVAVRTGAPLFVADDLMDAEGIMLAVDEEEDGDEDGGGGERQSRGDRGRVPEVPRHHPPGGLLVLITLAARARAATRTVLAIAVVAAAGAVLGGCSSGSSTTTTTPPRSTAHPDDRHHRRPRGRRASRPTSSVATGPQRCPTTQLVGSVAAGNGAAGTIETTVVLRNTSTATCLLGGYPGLQMLGPGRTALPTTVVRKGVYSFTAQLPTTVTLAPRQATSFNIGYSDVPVGGETSCPTSIALEVTPPGAFDHLTVPATLAPCDHGTLVVSPVLPGSAPVG